MNCCCCCCNVLTLRVYVLYEYTDYGGGLVGHLCVSIFQRTHCARKYVF